MQPQNSLTARPWLIQGVTQEARAICRLNFIKKGHESFLSF